MSIKLEEVIPENDNVLLVVENLEKQVEGINIDDKPDQYSRAFYETKVVAIGPNGLCLESGCPGLEIGDKAIIDRFDGVNIPTKDVYSKLVRGYGVIAMVKKNGIMLATNDRILVEVLDENFTSEEGVDYEKSADPRERETQKGKVINCGPNAIQYPEGTVVFFDPFCGNLIVNEPTRKIKTINSFDVLFKI
jgi:co-chaperonin GroES (HSP10)